MISNKKIGITGHSSGIGRALNTALQDSNEIFGFSYNTGHDLTIKENYNYAVSVLKTCDIVINNAYSGVYMYL